MNCARFGVIIRIDVWFLVVTWVVFGFRFHVALTVALQRFFNESGNNPVGGFLIYDQPSQVYFPRRLADEGKVEKSAVGEDRAKDLRDEDVEAVKKIFSTVAKEIKKDKGSWQAIILDHAPT